MNIVGIVCEYNPFHLGHLYQLAHTRAELNADAIVAIMSGNFTQRGECAVIDKYYRTQMALAAGIDVVLELPAVYATAASGYFATGAVLSLAQTGVVNYLSFGSESGELAALEKIADILSTEPFEYRELLQSLLSAGLSYPRAQHQALQTLYHIDSFADITPNDLLGVNYLTAIKRYNLPIEPFCVTRVGSHHDNTAAGFTSSQNIREKLALGATVDNDLPAFSYEILRNAALVNAHKTEDLALALLRRSTAESLAALPDINTDLAHRLLQASREYCTLDEVLAAAKNKSCTYSRLKRAMCHLLLRITAADYEPAPRYLRVLGFSANGAKVLKMMKKSAALPLVTTLSNVKNTLDAKARHMLTIDLQSSDIYRAFSHEFAPRDEFRLFPLKYF